MKRSTKKYKNVRLREDTYAGVMGLKADGISIDAEIRRKFGMPPRRYD